MRNINILVIQFVILSIYGCGQISTEDKDEIRQKADTPTNNVKPLAAKETVDTTSYIEVMEKYMDSVDKNLSGLSLSKVDVFGESSEGGEIGVYSNHSDTVKLKALYYGETGKNEYNLYFHNKQLVVFKEVATYYNAPISKKPVKIDSVISATFVVHKGSILSGKKGRLDIDKNSYEEKSSDISGIYSEIKKQLRE